MGKMADARAHRWFFGRLGQGQRWCAQKPLSQGLALAWVIGREVSDKEKNLLVLEIALLRNMAV